jgi:hypothetical protein
MTKKQIYDVIKQELDWHEQHRGMMPEDYERGFLAGLKQVMILVKEMRV